MADLTFTGKNNQKKTYSVFTSDYCSTGANTFGMLPPESLVTAAYVVVKTADGTANATVDIMVGTTVIANEVDVDAVATIEGSVTPTYFETGGQISVAAGAVPGAGDGSIKVVIEFIETELTNGQYLR